MKTTHKILPGVVFYKQGDGAVNADGACMESGWYWNHTCESQWNGTPMPYGLSFGPYTTLRGAQRAYRNTKTKESM